MAFQVTQCPNCGSTFHTNPKLLELAEGKVRCGACLSVFDALENLVANESASIDAEEESVFVGSQPEDFFDPSVFLTRSALSLPDKQEETNTSTSTITPADTGIASDPQMTALGSDIDNNSTFSDYIATEEIETSSYEADRPEHSQNVFADVLEKSSESTGSKHGETEDSEYAEQPASLENLESAENLWRTENPESREISGSLQTSEVNRDFDRSVISEKSAEEQADTSIVDERLEFFSAINESMEALENPDELSELEELAQLTPSESTNHDLFEQDEDQTIDESEVETNIVQDLNGNSARDEDTVPRESLTSKSEEYSSSASFTLQAPFTRSPPIAESKSSTEDAADIHNQQDSDLVREETLQPRSEIEIVKELEEDDFGIAVKQAIEERDLAEAIQKSLEKMVDTVESVEVESPPQGSTDQSGTAGEQVTAPGGNDYTAHEVSPPGTAVDPPLATESEEPEAEISTDTIRARALNAELEDDEALEEIPAENLTALERVATPLELSSHRQRHWGRTLSMLSLCLLFSVSIAGQYAWQHRATYSLDPRFRSYFEQACAWVACQLPEFSEIESIRSDNLAVRSHPDREEALMVTVEIRNTAAFEQRFPILILSFNNVSNDTIALRELSPDEYLDEGLREFELMPVLSPVQVTLPIIDPGADATNYTLAFRSP